MKIRQAFVANSSSSSFLIGCNLIPTTIDEAKKEFFSHGAEFVSDLVLNHMIENMKPFKLDLKLLLEMAKTKKWKNIYTYMNNITAEQDILAELASEFEYREKYHKNGFIWNSSNLKPFEQWTRAEEDKLVKKLGLARHIDIPWKDRKKIENRWFNKKVVKERFIQEIQWFCNDFNKYEVLMYGEFSDDSNVGSETEHGGHWDKVFTCRRFSHH